MKRKNLIKTAIIGVLVASIGGFFIFIYEDPRVSACKDALRVKLKAPSTLEIANVSTDFDGSPGDVTIAYDAANGYGAMLRGHIKCSFKKTVLGRRFASVRMDGETVDDEELRNLNLYVSFE